MKTRVKSGGSRGAAIGRGKTARAHPHGGGGGGGGKINKVVLLFMENHTTDNVASDVPGVNSNTGFMKKFFVTFLVLAACWPTFAQTSILFDNDAGSLVYTNALGLGATRGLADGGRGNFYFGLFLAPAGTTDPLAFVFSGGYATNTGIAGRYDGGNVVIPNWLPSQTIELQVRGWSSNLGPNWNPSWGQGNFGVSTGFYGESQIAQVVNPSPLPPISVGAAVGSFDLFVIPEPSGIGLAACLVMLIRLGCTIRCPSFGIKTTKAKTPA